MKTAIIRNLHMAGLKLKKVSPEILVVSGIVGVITSTVMACKASTKIDTVIEPTVKKLEKIHATAERIEAGEDVMTEDGKPYTMKDVRNDTVITYALAGSKLAKLYGPAIVIGAASIGCIIGSHNILNKRNAALAAAYTAVDKSFKEYRDRVVKRFGNELDRELRFDVHNEEVETTDAETGETKTDTIAVAKAEHDEFTRYFTKGCKGYTKDYNANRHFLKMQEAYANDKLKRQGYLFLNDVYTMLGFPISAAGQVAGWIYDSELGEHQVDFGVYNMAYEENRDFINGFAASALLDFNVHHNILSMI